MLNLKTCVKHCNIYYFTYRENIIFQRVLVGNYSKIYFEKNVVVGCKVWLLNDNKITKYS